MPRVLMPLPKTDFDPTESAIPWRVLTNAGVEVVFATPDGEPGAADVRMVEGSGLGPWRPFLRAAPIAREAYSEMTQSGEFREPSSWSDIASAEYDGLILPGGHAQGMRPYLESEKLQEIAADFMRRDAPVGAICHGVVLLARATEDDRSVLEGRRATALLQAQEMSAFGLTALWLGRYYRTYRQTVEGEVRDALGESGTFEKGPLAIARDTPDRLDRGFVVVDDNLVTARWPGDAHRFSNTFLELLEGS